MLRIQSVAAVLFGVLEMIAGLMPSYLTFALMTPLLGLSALTMITAANATVQLSSAPVMRGRVMALYMMIFMGGTPVGAPVVGWIGEEFGARWTLIGGGGMTVLGVLLAELYVSQAGIGFFTAQGAHSAPVSRHAGTTYHVPRPKAYAFRERQDRDDVATQDRGVPAGAQAALELGRDRVLPVAAVEQARQAIGTALLRKKLVLLAQPACQPVRRQADHDRIDHEQR